GETDGDGPFVSAIAATARTVPADSRNCKERVRRFTQDRSPSMPSHAMKREKNQKKNRAKGLQDF
ncbi:MAG: hypothetical protein IKE25_08855, partial [Clostridia bacterium]|nr:hypothetical protein [Clostridia bacterium]